MSEMKGRKIAIWRWVLTLASSAPLAELGGIVMREAMNWTSDEMTARRLRPEKSEPAVPMMTSGTPQFTPNAVGWRQALRTCWRDASRTGAAWQPRSRSLIPKTSIIGWGLKFWRPWLKTE